MWVESARPWEATCLGIFQVRKSSVGTGTPHIDLPKVIRNNQTSNCQFSPEWDEGPKGEKNHRKTLTVLAVAYLGGW